MTRAVLWLHRWVGLTAGAALAVISLTGVVLLFQAPLLRALHPELQPTPVPGPADAAQALPRILDDWSGRGLRALDLPHEAMPAWQLYFADGTRRYLDARSGALLLERTAANDALLWLRELHVHLLGGARGEQVLGVLGLLSLFLLASGLWRWWPRGPWRSSLALHRQPASVRWLSWHRTAGVLTLPATLVLIVTGTAMVYNAPVRQVLTGAFGGEADVAPPAPVAHAGGPIDWPAAMRAAQTALPEARLSRISVPAPGQAVVAMRARMPAEWHPVGRSLVWIDANTAQVLRAHDATGQGLGARMSEAIYPLHGAFVGGTAWVALSVAAGLLLNLIFATGLLFWCTRR